MREIRTSGSIRGHGKRTVTYRALFCAAFAPPERTVTRRANVLDFIACFTYYCAEVALSLTMQG
jgi:hypothetical protein